MVVGVMKKIGRIGEYIEEINLVKEIYEKGGDL